MDKVIYIRVDGNNFIGYGHVFRCLSLAEMIYEICDPVFVLQNSTDFIVSQIKNSNFQIIQIPHFDNLVSEAEYLNLNVYDDGCTVILDGYQYTSEYQKELKLKNKFLICIDDLHQIHFYADVIINQAESVNKDEYSIESYTKVCTGYQWVLQRKAFREIVKKKCEKSNFNTAFFTLGGAYVRGIASNIFAALDEFETIIFLKGNEELFSDEIKPVVKKNPKIKVFEKLDANEMVNLIKQSDVAVCPASVVALEACAVGVLLFTGITADNQRGNYKGLINTGVAIALGDLRTKEIAGIKEIITENSTKNIYENVLQKQNELFDGKSKERYIDLIKNGKC